MGGTADRKPSDIKYQPGFIPRLRWGWRDPRERRVRAAARWRTCILRNNSHAGFTFNAGGPQPFNQHATLPSLVIVTPGDWSGSQLGREDSRNSIDPVKGPWSGRSRRPRPWPHGVSQVSRRSAKPSAGTVSVNEIVAEISPRPVFGWAVQHSDPTQEAPPWRPKEE